MDRWRHFACDFPGPIRSNTWSPIRLRNQADHKSPRIRLPGNTGNPPSS